MFFILFAKIFIKNYLQNFIIKVQSTYINFFRLKYLVLNKC